MEGAIIVILCTLYCNVFSPVNEAAFMCFGGGVALEGDLQGGWDLMLLKLACYC